MPTSPVLDPTVIAELQQVMGGDFAVLVQSFRRDGEQRLALLKEAHEAGDEQALQRQAHSFKGSSSNLGANQVADICLALEKAASADQPDRKGELIAALEVAFHQACTALNRPAL